MRISFDLDDTLICYGDGFPCEPRLPLYWRWLVKDEPLRQGARTLMRQLCQRGCEIWIYTTSYRSPGGVAWWLRLHGIRVGKVINQFIHERHNRPGGGYYPPSKNPRRFGIDLHVDDSEGVRMEGEEHGFDVVVVSPTDLNWTDRVLQAVSAIEFRSKSR